jgi:hypothetical protein
MEEKIKKSDFFVILFSIIAGIMQLQEHKKIYISDEEIFSFQDTLLNNISFKVFVQCSKERFL